MPDDLAIRPARPADAAPMLALARAAYAHYVPRMGVEPLPMTVDYATLIASGVAFVAEQGDRRVGQYALVVHPDHLELENFAVDPDVQGAGVGTAMLDWAEAYAHEQGRTEIRLCTNVVMVENIAYYARRGYLETHRGFRHERHRVFFSKRV